MIGQATVGAMAVVLAIAPFVFLNGNFDPANLSQSAWVQAWGLAFAAWVLACRERLGASSVDSPLGLLIAWGLLSVAWATSRGEAIPVAMQWAACGAWFVAVSRTVTRPAEGRVLALALFASGAAVAVLGLAQHLFAAGLVYQAVPPAATFVNKNIAAQYVIATLPLGLAALVEWPGRPRVTLGGAACVVGAASMAIFVGATRTRSAWAAGAVEGVVVAALVLRHRWLPANRPGPAVTAPVAAAIIAAAAVACAVLAMRGSVLPAAGSSSEAATTFTSVGHRQAIWLNTTAMIADAPLRGVGLGNHKVHYPPYARRVAVDQRLSARTQLDHVHNDALQLAAETGLVGAALCAWLVVASVAVARRAAFVFPGPLTVAWAAAAAGIAVDALFSFPMQRALPPVVLAVGLGSMAGLAGLRPGPGRLLARSLAVVATAALVPAGIHQARAIRADRHVRRMLAAEARGSWGEVRDAASAALAQDPDDRRALFSLGTAELARRRLPEARAALQRVLDQHPHDLPALGNLALTQAAVGEDAAALASWERVLALDPGDPRAHFGRGEIFARMGAAELALQSFRLAAEFDGRDVRSQLRLGAAAARAGFHGEAMTAFRTATSLAPDNAAAHEGLGNALIAFGQDDDGRRHLEKARAHIAPR